VWGTKDLAAIDAGGVHGVRPVIPPKGSMGSEKNGQPGSRGVGLQQKRPRQIGRGAELKIRGPHINENGLIVSNHLRLLVAQLPRNGANRGSRARKARPTLLAARPTLDPAATHGPLGKTRIPSHQAAAVSRDQSALSGLLTPREGHSELCGNLGDDV
jgi:hypothetical protein